MPLNAGFGLYGPIEDIGIDEARYPFDVNAFGPGIRARFKRVTQRFRMAEAHSLTAGCGPCLYSANTVTQTVRTPDSTIAGVGEVRR